MRAFLGVLLLIATAFVADVPQAHNRVVRFVFTSDAHYGLTRRTFRGKSDVSAHEVNAAGKVLARGCEAMGIAWTPTPLATVSAPRGDSPKKSRFQSTPRRRVR